MRVFVAGGSGVLGRRLIPQLVARGHDVTATTTRPDRLPSLAALGATAVVMHGLDVASVAEAVARARPDVVVHQMTGISRAHAGEPDMRHWDRWAAPTVRLRTVGTDHLLAAAAATGVAHVVAQSYGGWNGAPTGSWVKTEADPLYDGVGTAFEASAAAIRHVERAVTAVGGAALRYGALYGPGATDDQVELLRRGRYPLIGDGAGHMSWVHLDDAAAATVCAVERGAQGIFNVGDDDPAPACAWLPHLARCVGARPPRRVPRWLARLLAGDVPVTMMTAGRGFSNARARRELGWTLRFPSWREGFGAGLG